MESFVYLDYNTTLRLTVIFQLKVSLLAENSDGAQSYDGYTLFII